MEKYGEILQWCLFSSKMCFVNLCPWVASQCLCLQPAKIMHCNTGVQTDS